MRDRYAALGVCDQLVAAGECLAGHGTTIEASLGSTIEGLKMPGYLLDNGLSEADLAVLYSRLTE